MKQTVFDHLAIGTRTLTDSWQRFGGLLGGTWVYGGDSPGYWWGQLGSSRDRRSSCSPRPTDPTARFSSGS